MASNKKMSKKKKRRLMRKIIPIIVALILIVIIAAVGLGTGAIKKYSYSTQKADLYEYLGLTSPDEVVILMDNEYIDTRAISKDNHYYIPMDMVAEYFYDDFYYDEHENKLMYTTATDVISTDESSGDFITKNGEMYLSLDYVKDFSNLEYKVFEGPNHMELKYKWGSQKVARVLKDTKLRVLGGVKSEILTSLNKDDVVRILNPMEDWCQVISPDGYIGFVEIKELSDTYDEEETPVNDVTPIEIKHTLRDHKICLGWHQVMSETANDTLSSVASGKGPLNVISPTWFSITDNSGSIANIGTADYVARAHEMGLEVWGLVDNFNPDVDSYELLSHEASRRQLEANLINAALELGIEGINIDFEGIPSEAGEPFAQFIRELSIPCRNYNLVLSVDNYVPQQYTSFYRRDVQGKYADYVIIMGYDEHYAGSETAGSVASFDFVKDGIDKTLLDVDKSQVINGIPFYTRVWKEEENGISSEAVDMETAKNSVESRHMEVSWDDACAQNYAETTSGGITYRVWLEDAQSIKSKLDLMNSYDIAGVACWKLGFETEDIWDVIGSYIGN